MQCIPLSLIMISVFPLNMGLKSVPIRKFIDYNKNKLQLYSQVKEILDHFPSQINNELTLFWQGGCNFTPHFLVTKKALGWLGRLSYGVNMLIGQ